MLFLTKRILPSIVAQQCIQKSLLLLNFLPVRPKTEGLNSDHLEDPGQVLNGKRHRTSSVVEADFQASHLSPACEATGFPFPEGGQNSELKKKQVPDSPQRELASASQNSSLEKNSEPEETLSPPSTPTRKPPFSRGRLRLLSFRSMEESKPAPSIKEKYPILKDILDFIKNQSLSHER